MSDRPNIIYIFTDQQTGGAIRCAGNSNLKTPAMDSLASRGVRFANAYCSYPLCVPSRMSMMTGRMPHELGIFANCLPTERPLNCPTLGTLFRTAGYDTTWIGKWHLTIPEDRVAQHGFEEIVLGGDYGGSDRAKADGASAFLTRVHHQPFLLVVSLNNPHDCCELSRGDDLRMGEIPPPPREKDLPPLPDNYEIPIDEPDYLRVFARQYDRIFQAMRWSEIQARQYLWGYYRLVEMVDREIGRILEAVQEAGLEENTVVLFSSDHGDGAGCHRWNQKFSLYDEPARVPLIITPPDCRTAGQVVAQPVSAGLDLLPTACDFADILVPTGLRGNSLRSVVDGQVMNGGKRDFVVSETSFSMWGEVGQDEWPKARMVRSDGFKYTVYDTGEIREQLVDVTRDPGEMINLAMDTEHAPVLALHRRYLSEWCEDTGDPFELK